MNNVRCLVGVTMTIIEPGTVLDENYLSALMDDAVLWKLPAECKEVDDCLVEAGYELVEVFHEGGKWETVKCPRWRFVKWAVYFHFNHIGQCVDRFGRGAMSPLSNECWNIGSNIVFEETQDMLIDLADPFIDLLASEGQIDSILSINFPTVWLYEAGWSYHYEGSEWETNWWCEGRLDLDTLQIVQPVNG